MSYLLPLICIPFTSTLFIWIISNLFSSPRIKKWTAFALSLFPLLVLIAGYGHWQGAKINLAWIPTLGINFHLALDGISILFILLTAIVVPITIAMVLKEELYSPGLFYALVLLLQGLLFLLFSARDLALFTISWEAIILPLYFIISLWGGSHRQGAAIKFLIYMIAGSCLLVAAVLGLYFTSPEHTFNMDVLKNTAEQTPYAPLFLGIVLLAFAVKTPLFPFHAWLPDAYVQAPFAGSILLAALLSKAGIYGIARIGIEMFPQSMSLFGPTLLILAIIGTLYGAITAWMQNDYKTLIAYSSFSHVNFILAGLFIGSELGLQGAILQAFNHGITITALFIAAAWLKQRVGTTDIPSLGGTAKFYPILCWITLFFVLSSVALPGTNNFVGELMILLSLFQKSGWLSAVLATSIILSALYMLRWMQKVYFEIPKGRETSIDLTKKEICIALPLICLILAVGIYPAPLLNLLKVPQMTEAATVINTSLLKMELT